ncbi:MAG: hypothetical protein HQK63_16305 [Desulfamplus sp.]|nr:hypothetical protein [Desulfamplus sp.]
MARIPLTDDSGKWFDSSKASRFHNRTRWNGRNNISLSAGEHNQHILYRTASGRWVLNFSSQWANERETYSEITDKEAAQWFVINEYENEEIPQDLLPLVKPFIDDMEV